MPHDDSLADAWTSALNNFLDGELDDYQAEFVSKHLIKAGVKGLEHGEGMPDESKFDEIIIELCSISDNLSPRQRSFLFSMAEDIQDENDLNERINRDD
jgi:hypothetical protein